MSRHRHRIPMVSSILGSGVLLAVAVLIAALLTPVPMEKLSTPPSALVYDSQGGLMHAFLAPDDRWRVRVSYEDVTSEFLEMLISYEDRYFYRHAGVNPLALCRALVQNIRAGRIVSGGSTLTMQVARLLDPKPRTIASKAIEILQAINLEIRYSKADILSMYLNLAPYGGNIEGIGAASLLYFAKKPSDLSTAEAALLVALPRSPESLRPDRFSQEAKEARDRVLNRATLYGAIDDRTRAEALTEDVPSSRRQLPAVAPHLSRLLAQRYGSGEIHSTLSPNLQLEISRMLSQHIARLKPHEITNGAAIVIENQTHSIVAYVGSADFYDVAAHGQVDGVRAPRSPGSTLKPFIYALALDRGIITPMHYLEDVPVSYGDYSPQNYSKKFSGLVSATTALSQSLNIPAVNLLSAVGVDEFSEFLRHAGLASISRSHTYGLSMAIGGCDATLLELTSLYSALANNGVLFPLHFVRDPNQAGASDQSHTAVALLSQESAFLISQILSNNARPDFPPGWESTSLPRVAWKTGTSYGHRDAWSIGYSPRYTAGVWIGNFSGEESSRLVGAEVAAPLLFQIMNRLSEGLETEWFDRPQTLATREVCSLSGMPPGPHCPTRKQDYYIPGKSSNETCELHRVALIDETTGMRVPDYLKGSPGITQVMYVHWPPAMASWLSSMGTQGYDPPALDPEFIKKVSGNPPRIVSPVPGHDYQLRPGVDADMQKLSFIAEAGADTKELYWFVDGELVGTSRPGEAMSYVPVAGTHELVCQDEMGRATRMKLSICASD